MAEAKVAEIDKHAVALEIETATLMGDLRTAILDRLRAMPKPWTVMSEGEQSDLIAGCERVAVHLVTEATRIVAAKRLSGNRRPSRQMPDQGRDAIAGRCFPARPPAPHGH